jgi:hypothetical protein
VPAHDVVGLRSDSCHGAVAYSRTLTSSRRGQAERDKLHQEELRRNRCLFHLIRLGRALLWRERRLSAAAAAGGGPGMADEAAQLPRVIPSRLASAM